MECQVYQREIAIERAGDEDDQKSPMKIDEEIDQTWWKKYKFIVLYLIAVVINPLYLYIPVINGKRKCLKLDPKLLIVACVLRSAADAIYISHMVSQIHFARKQKKEHSVTSRISATSKNPIIIIGVLASLPLPQVLIFVYWRFELMPFFIFLLNFLVFIQYVARVLRIYASGKEYEWTFDTTADFIWIRGAFNLFLYIAACHVLGAFWYYFSILRAIQCWAKVCEKEGCLRKDFICKANNSSPRYLKFDLDKFCPLNSTNESPFNFGIYKNAFVTGIVQTQDFPKKVLQCFLWGLRNLSSFGQNLEGSGYVWETCFAAFVSIMGLLLFIYLIGNLQTYMQLDTTSTQRMRQKIKLKKPEIQKWISSNFTDPKLSKYTFQVYQAILKNVKRAVSQEKDFDFEYLFLALEGILLDEKKRPSLDEEGRKINEIIEAITDQMTTKGKNVLRDTRVASADSWMAANIPQVHKSRRKIFKSHLYKLEDDVRNVNMVNLMSVLPLRHKTFIKEQLMICSTRLECLRNELQIDIKLLLDLLEPVTYEKESYIIRKGEPLDFMFFITQGVVLSFESSSSSSTMIDHFANRIEKFTSYLKEKDEQFGEGSSTSTSHLDVANLIEKCVIILKGEGEGSNSSGGKVEIEYLRKNAYYGVEELKKWTSTDDRSTNNYGSPISKKNLKSHTEVEGFVLKAMELKKILHNKTETTQEQYGTTHSQQYAWEQFGSYAAEKTLSRIEKKKKNNKKQASATLN